MTYVHHRDNGEIDPIYIDQTGVGQYDAGVGEADAAHTLIQAENYFDLLNAMEAECPEGGFEMRGLRGGSVLEDPNVHYLRRDSPLSLRVSCGSVVGGTIEVHMGAPDGQLLGTCAVAPTGAWNTYKTVTCQLKNSAEKQTIYLVFRSVGTNEFCHLNWFCFNTLPGDVSA